MFNTYTFDTQVFNKSMIVLSDFVDGEIVYGNYILHNTQEVYASLNNSDDYGDVDMDIWANPLDDGSTLSSYFKRGRIVTIQGTINKSNAEELNKEIDTMKSHLSVPGQKLSVKVNGEIRECTSYTSGLTFDRQHYNISFVKYSVSFTITDEARESRRYETVSTTGVTSTLLEEVINYGKYKSKPIIIITLNSATSVDEMTLTLGDYMITINETLSASDILQIDRETLSVTINNAPIDYVGVIPTLEQGRNNYSITMNGTYNYDVTIKYKKRFT